MLTKKKCPRCGSEDIEIISSGDVNNFMCKNCGYAGNMEDKMPIMEGENE